jgi:S-adenosylmethionine synthetase
LFSGNAIHVQELTGFTPDEMDVEIVERKGLGHPDTICDQVMEQISQALCRAYVANFKSILHHNIDKGLLIAGQVERRFGGGRVTEPMRLVIGDRATPVKEFDVADIAVEAAKRWFRERLPGIDTERDVKYQVELKAGSDELTDIFRQSKAVAVANDTSAAVGYAPLTETERLVLAAERFLNSAEFKTKFPDTGTDVKVMGVRRGAKLALTVAMPLLDRYVHGEQDYFRRKEEAREALLAYLKPRLEKSKAIVIHLNALDRRQAGLRGMYLSVLGTSAEDADSGQVGRGNQVNGIIALNRPRGSEAAAGKNPVSHVGKIYSVLTYLLAEQIYGEVPGLRQVMVWLCGRIGDPVDQPQIAAVQIALDRHTMLADVRAPTTRIMLRELKRIPQFCQSLASGQYSIC